MLSQVTNFTEERLGVSPHPLLLLLLEPGVATAPNYQMLVFAVHSQEWSSGCGGRVSSDKARPEAH